MDKGYFAHNVFERTDPCNRTTIYYKAQVMLLFSYNNNNNKSILQDLCIF